MATITAFVKAPETLSRAMGRVSAALARYAPSPAVCVAPRASQASLMELHTVGFPDIQALVEELQSRGKKYVIIQYCLRTTQKPNTKDWMAIWQGAELVWSYYDLPAMCRADGVAGDFKFYHSPLGADSSVFGLRSSDRPRYTILTSGYVAETEGVKEAAEAVRRVKGEMFHLGPNLFLGDHVTHRLGLTDEELADAYRDCEFVAGLRRVEGFELPAVEGLLCGARPIMFDAPHYRHWFEPWAEFVQEGPPDTVTRDLEALFREGARPVSEIERQHAINQFNWKTIVEGFWTRLLGE